MKHSIIDKAVLAIGIVAILIAIFCAVYGHIHSFSGQVCVATGHKEDIVVREAVEAPRFTFLVGVKIERAVEPSAIPFQDSATAMKLITPDQKYDFVRLPYSLALKNVSVVNEVEPRNEVKVKAPDSETTADIAVGAELSVENESYKVAAIRKWSGLLRDAKGKPMAAISIRRPGGASGHADWEKDIFLEEGAWRRLDADSVIRFSWVSSEDAAKDALGKGLPGIESARWGIVDRNTVNWFDSFSRGTGAQLADGTVVTLTQLDEHQNVEGKEGPAIEVEIDEGGKTRDAWVPANDDKGPDPIRFEYFAKLPAVMTLYAWEDGSALAAGYKNGAAAGKKQIAAGETVAGETWPFDMRLDQVMSQAAPVEQKNSPLYEAVLAGPSRELRLRQGEAVRVADTLLEYVRTAPPPTVRYQLTAAKPGEKGKTVTIGPDGSAQIGPWKFSQETGAAEPLRVAVLRAEFYPMRNEARIALGIALAAFVWAFFLARHEKSGSAQH